MIKEKKICAIIPARGGSKRIPKKNIKLLAGKPMIGYTIETALESGCFSDVMVSTEDDNISDVSTTYGAKIIKRPNELATNGAQTIDVVLHAIKMMEKEGNMFDAIALLQPTSPLRTAEDIWSAADLFFNNDCDGVISVCESSISPYWAMGKKGIYLAPLFGWEYVSQRAEDLPKAYFENGSIYIFTANGIKERRGFYTEKIIPFIMPPERSIDVDTEMDFSRVCEIIERRKL